MCGFTSLIVLKPTDNAALSRCYESSLAPIVLLEFSDFISA